MVRSLVLAAAVFGSAAWTWADEPVDSARFTIAVGGGNSDAGLGGSVVVQGKYFIGVACGPVEPALRKHLSLEEGVGVIVLSVRPDSPAAKAGVELFDVLVRAGDKPLHSVMDLVKIVDETGEAELPLKVIHQGKESLVTVKPVERPEAEQGQIPPMPMDPEAAARWFERVIPGDPGGAGMRFRFFSPGVILPEGAPTHAPLPGDLSVSITKQGDQPAEIRVQRGDENWNVKENELDKLPADIRPHVERMLGGHGPAGAVFGLAPGMRLPGMPGGDGEPSRPERLERQLREVKERLDRITKELSEMRHDRGNDEQPAEPKK